MNTNKHALLGEDASAAGTADIHACADGDELPVECGCRCCVELALVLLPLVHKLTSCTYARQTVSFAVRVMLHQAPLCMTAYTPTFIPEDKMQTFTE